MIVSNLQRLTQDGTYHDLALRCQEFLHYHQQESGEFYQLAEDLLFNALVAYLVQVGLTCDQAEAFCADPNNLIELAMRISSTLGPVALPRTALTKA